MNSRTDKRSGFSRRLLMVASLLVVGLLALAFLRVGPAPVVEVDPAMPGIGSSTPVTVRASEEGRGLSSLAVELVQGENLWLLDERSYEPRPFWAFWGNHTTDDTVEVEVGKSHQKELVAGEAVLRVRAGRAATWLRHPGPAVTEITLPVRLIPPRLAILSRPNIVEQGGSGVVVYRVGEGTARDGVTVGEDWFPGYPLPAGAEGERFALFAAPYELSPSDGGGSAFRVVAEDDLGNRAEQSFVDTYRARPPTTDTIGLDDGFMSRVVPEILSYTPQVEDRGDLLQNYLALNGELRKANAERLAELAAETRPEMLWDGPFRQLASSQVMAPFADRRTYTYGGEKVDQQDHLGYDLASNSQAPVGAANHGVVVMAEYFGIYGNTVVLDHGQGLFSLYAHLSSIDAEVGQELEKGAPIGKTGQTGLAGGDHLHYSMLVHGHFVQPLEWWDARWVRDRVLGKLGAGEETAETGEGGS